MNNMANFDEKFESNNQDWETPQDLFDTLNSEFKFDTDLAATDKNKKCMAYYSISEDALKRQWKGVCWLNPPYGSKDYKLKDWVKKSWQESKKDGCIVVLLIPARTNTGWWHDYCMHASEIRFIKGRPKFNNSDHGLPQPLAIVIFKKETSMTILKSFDMKDVRPSEQKMMHEYERPK